MRHTKARRGAVASPKKGMQLSKSDISALVIAAIVAVAGFGYFAVTYKSGGSGAGYVGETVTMQITYGPNGVTPIYFPANFTVGLGQHVTLEVTNLLNTTHGLAVPSTNVNTGPITPFGTASVTLATGSPGNFTISEPSSDCGGGSCDSHADLVGWYVVTSTV